MVFIFKVVNQLSFILCFGKDQLKKNEIFPSFTVRKKHIQTLKNRWKVLLFVCVQYVGTVRYRTNEPTKYRIPIHHCCCHSSCSMYSRDEFVCYLQICD
jgi:hypothetical protein